MASRVVIASAVRTPFTRALKGEFKDTRPDTLAAVAIRAAVAAVPGLQPSAVDDVVLGCAMPEAEQGMNVARQAALLAGLPDTVPAMTINRFCSSGVQSIAQVAQSIAAGMYDVAVAGGTESMTHGPDGREQGLRQPGADGEAPGGLHLDGRDRGERGPALRDPPRRPGRLRLREPAAGGRGAREGQLQGRDRPGEDRGLRRGGQRPTQVTVTEDTILRPDTTLEGLAKLKPAFNPKGTVTAGNASPLTDGAARRW